MEIYIQKNYCVYHTIYKGSNLPPNYIGSSTIKKVKSGYKGSVKSKKYKKIWEQELINNPNLFETTIISTHHTREEALYKELVLQKIFNVVSNPLFVNESFAIPNGFFGRDVSGKNNPNHNNIWDKKQKEHLSNIRKNKQFKEKVEQTNIKKYGEKYHLSTQKSKNKIKQTVFQKYGVENVSQIPEIKQLKSKKVKETQELKKIKRFGFDTKKDFIAAIITISNEQDLTYKNGRINVGKLATYFISYGDGCYPALLRFVQNNNL